jgi:hypothetical protein
MTLNPCEHHFQNKRGETEKKSEKKEKEKKKVKENQTQMMLEASNHNFKNLTNIESDDDFIKQPGHPQWVRAGALIENFISNTEIDATWEPNLIATS